MISTDPVVQEVIGLTKSFIPDFYIKAAICIIVTTAIGLAIWFIASRFRK